MSGSFHFSYWRVLGKISCSIFQKFCLHWTTQCISPNKGGMLMLILTEELRFEKSSTSGNSGFASRWTLLSAFKQLLCYHIMARITMTDGKISYKKVSIICKKTRNVLLILTTHWIWRKIKRMWWKSKLLFSSHQQMNSLLSAEVQEQVLSPQVCK